MCFRRITDHFAHVILFHSCLLLHIRLLTTFNSFRASDLCKSGWNESSQLYAPEKIPCLFVVHLRGDGIDFFSSFFFCQAVGVTCRPPLLVPLPSRAPINRIELIKLKQTTTIIIHVQTETWLILLCRQQTPTSWCHGGVSGVHARSTTSNPPGYFCF